MSAVQHYVRGFATAAAHDSPLYGRLAELIAGSPTLLSLVAGSREGSPMVFLAAVHNELLRDPGHPLAAYYPTVGGSRAPDDELGLAFEDFVTARGDRLATTLATRSTQTNETGRCSALLPAFAAVAGGRPLAQIEIGSSAGLNGLWDHYAYDYDGRPAGDPSSPLLIGCELRGDRIPPLDPPPVVWRANIDLSPVDLNDPDDVRWLRACLWPDQPVRHARFDAALAVAREHGPVPVRRGNALELLPEVIAQAPAEALVCVFHTAVVAYFEREQIDALRELLGGVERELVWVAGEAPGLLIDEPFEEGMGAYFILSGGPPDALASLGRMGHHGAWLEWAG